MALAQMNKAIKWDNVELDYRLGVKSLRIMAAEHGCAESAIRKRANRDLWGRDLAAKVRLKATHLIEKATVRNQVRAETPVETKQIDVFAHLQSNVVLCHRKDIQRARKLTMALLSDLEFITDNQGLLEEFRQMMFSPDEKGQDKRDEQFRKMISLTSRAGIMKQLSDALKSLVVTEREVFELNRKQSETTGIEALVKRVMFKNGE